MSDFFAPRDPGKPSSHPIGSRVSIQTPMEDHHFFRVGETGTVVRHADRDYLGVIVRLDTRIRCDHGTYRHDIDEFNFSARDLRALGEVEP